MKTKSIYIHVPFCKNICSYCDFAKLYYNKKWASIYLDALNFEIKEKYKEEPIRTLYIGGGTPNALDLEELEKLFIILSIFKNVTEYTIECNIELLTLDQIKLFVKYGINRVSLGIQTSHQKYLKFLNRNHSKVEVENKIQMLKDNGISNINVDFIYALPGQTIKELKEDIEFFKSLSIPHISTYSLIIEPNTVLYNQNVNYVDEDIDASMYNLIIEELKEFNHYETSNFALPNYESKHNLTYWNNEEYYGFVVGASGYIDIIRYTNTRRA